MRPARAWVALLLAACQEQSGPGPGSASTTTKPGVEIVAAPVTDATTDVASIVAAEVARTRHAGRQLLVYVGATWCEPCQAFHQAAASGALDSVFPTLRLLEFDLDRDADALQRAGYGSRMIPLFAEAHDDGTRGRHVEGSIKGPGAVADLTPRLVTLLAPAD